MTGPSDKENKRETTIAWITDHSRRSEICMGSAGIDFNVALEAFLHWLQVSFGIGGGIG
jgi:hypothetical protein